MLTCHDCGVVEGAIHQLGCDNEDCPWCGHQLISCGCVYEKLEIDVSPGTWAYSNGLRKSQYKKWESLLNEAGRIPFILYPNLCAGCGELWPDMFMVPDVEWEHYIQPDKRDEMLCYTCYQHIQEVIDANSGKPPIRNQPRFIDFKKTLE